MLRNDIEICHRWWNSGRRAWQHSVDIPEDVKPVEAKITAEWVVSLDNALLEVLGSPISGRAKKQIKTVCEVVMEKWLESIDLSLL